MHRTKVLKILKDFETIQLEKMQQVEAAMHAKGVLDPVSVNADECELGKSLLSYKELLHELVGSQIQHKIESLHEKWHQEFAKFDAIFFHKKNASLFVKLTGRVFGRYGITEQEFLLAQRYYEALAEISGELLYYLEAAIHRVEALSLDKFHN